MNWNGALLLGLGGAAIVGLIAWALVVAARLKAIERSVQSIADNTSTLREIGPLLKALESNTSLLGGIGSVFGSSDRKKSR